jgi:hypothetical protein
MLLAWAYVLVQSERSRGIDSYVVLVMMVLLVQGGGTSS